MSVETHEHRPSGKNYVPGCEGCRDAARAYRRGEWQTHVREVRALAVAGEKVKRPEPKPEIKVEFMLSDARALLVALASGDNRGAAMLLSGLDRKELERVAITLCAIISRRDALNGKL